MNKKMREIYAKIENLSERANQYLDEGKTTEAEEIVNQINELERQYVVAEKLQNKKTDEITDEEIDKSIKDKKASGFAVIAKMLKGQKLNDVENAIIIESAQLMQKLPNRIQAKYTSVFRHLVQIYPCFFIGHVIVVSFLIFLHGSTPALIIMLPSNIISLPIESYKYKFVAKSLFRYLSGRCPSPVALTQIIYF